MEWIRTLHIDIRRPRDNFLHAGFLSPPVSDRARRTRTRLDSAIFASVGRHTSNTAPVSAFEGLNAACRLWSGGGLHCAACNTSQSRIRQYVVVIGITMGHESRKLTGLIRRCCPSVELALNLPVDVAEELNVAHRSLRAVVREHREETTLGRVLSDEHAHRLQQVWPL